METKQRAKISEDNKYYISKHRYYELLHFCRQYDEFVTEKRKIMDSLVKAINYNWTKLGNDPCDHTSDSGIKLQELNRKMEMIEQCAMKTDPSIYQFIIFAVTKGYGYVYLKETLNIPCGKNYFYENYRKFFWLLDKEKN